MGDHTHEAGEWMLSYRYMTMHMDGNRDGSSSLSAAEVLGQGFMVTPTEMDMEMHMFGAMYAPSDHLTLMAMIPYVSLSMDHLTGMGGEFTTESEGLGDIRLSGLHRIHDQEGSRVHVSIGLSLPTGSIDERDRTPMGPNSPLPYPMQLGSGTWDLLPGITWLLQRGDWSYGAQSTLTVRLGRNTEDYSLGDRLQATAWGARRLDENWSTSIRLAGETWGNIDGDDSDLNPAVIPTADPNLRGGTRVDAFLGVNFYGREGAISGQRVALEVGIPVVQDLDGPQLELDWQATLGWQYSF